MSTTESKTPETGADKEAMQHQCENCDRLLSDRQVVPPVGIRDYFDRVSPGEISPSGECMACGALTHLTEPVGPVKTLVDAARWAEDRLASLVDSTSPENYASDSEAYENDVKALGKLRCALRQFEKQTGDTPCPPSS
ncbi:MAG: hypothetical protein HYT87_12925 [Nitrospirae bacterium]|nr:hypothetical protein [Nitrospirota bacterium]